MPRFFTSHINETTGSITGADAKHISKVLRMKQGQPLTACDGNGQDYFCTIESLDEQEIILHVERVEISRAEPSLTVRLYQAMPKSDKFDLIIQKAVELGVGEIIPVQTHRCVSRPNAASMEKKLERFNRIAYEAAKQCGRGKIPPVRQMLSFEEAIQELDKASCAILFYENSQDSFKNVLETCQKEDISIFIGAEGGFELEEIQFAKKHALQLHVLSLGERILRCETAPIAVLSAIMYQTGNL